MKALAVTLALLTTASLAGLAAARSTQVEISVFDASGPEGNSGTRPLAFRVALSHSSSDPVHVSYLTQNETARASEDYGSTQDTIQFAPGETDKTVQVLVNGDRAVEPDEFFSVVLFDPIGATIAEPGGVGTGTIQNDDRNVALQACKCQGLRLRLAGFATHGRTKLQRRPAEFWDVVVKAQLTCGQGDVVACAGFVRTVSTSFASQKPNVFTCRGPRCSAKSTHTLKVRVKVLRTEIVRQRAAGRPLKKSLKLRSGCRGAPGAVKTFRLVLPKRI